MTLTVVSNQSLNAYVLLTAGSNVIAGQRQRFTVFATDAAGGNASQVYDVRVVNPPPQILSTRVELKCGVPVELALQATNGQGPLSWTFVDGPLPDGIQVDTNGMVIGTPTPDASEFHEDGLYTNLVQVADSFTDRITGEIAPRVVFQSVTQHVRLSYQYNIQPVRTNGPSLVNCILCHGSGFPPDFSSELASSLLNVNAGSGGICPNNDFYVLAGDPNDSLVVQKITAPSCGFRMPFGGPYLGQTQINRFIRWVTELTNEDND